MFSLPCAYATPSADSVARFVAERFEFGPVTACRMLNRSFNDVFVVERGIQKAVLRLSRAGRRRRSDLEYEAGLLTHLRSRSVAVAVPYRGCDGQYCQEAAGAEGIRLALLFDFVEGRDPQESPADRWAQGAALARFHAGAADFCSMHERVRLDLGHLLARPLAWMGPMLNTRPDDRAYLAGLAERLRRVVGERHGELSQCVCHGDCHGSNARIDSLGSATLIDFDDGGPGWVAYDLAVFLWTACAFFPQRRALWRYFLDGYRSVRPIPRADLDAVPLFVPLRHIWLLGEYAAGAGGWGTWWLGEWFDRQIAFLRAWEEEQPSDPLGLH
jgi:Ser/Thr protein kinase RdoA (MazF antagonist)